MSRSVGYVVVLLWIVNIFNYIDRMALPVLLPSIKAELRLSDSQLGLLVGLAFSVFYGLCGLPVARLADRTVRKNVIAGALAIWSLMTVFTGVAQNYWQFFLARVGVGAGEAGCIAPSQSLICDYVPPARRASVLAFHMTGVNMGTLLAMGLAAWLVDIIGWRMTLVALGAPGLIVALVVFLTVREPTRGAMESGPPAGDPPPLAVSLKMLAGNRVYRLIVVWYVLNGFMQYGSNQWWPSFFNRLHGLSMSAIGLPMGLAVGVGSAIGMMFGALYGDRLGERDVRLPIRLGAIATFASVASALAVLMSPSPWTGVGLIAVTNVLWGVSNGPVLAAIYNATPPQLRAVAGALPIFLTAILGFGMGPALVGLLSDQLAGAYGAQSLRYALILPILAAPPMGVLLWMTASRLRNAA